MAEGELSGKKKSLILQKVQRDDEVRLRISQGLSTETIKAEMCEKWGVTSATVDKVVRRVLEGMAEHARLYSTPAKIAHRKMQMEALLEGAIIDRDRKTAVTIIDRLCKIEGAYSPHIVQHAVKHQLETLSPSQKEERLSFLLKERKSFVEAECEVIDPDQDDHLSEEGATVECDDSESIEERNRRTMVDVPIPDDV